MENKKFIYLEIPIGTMNAQINVRIPKKLLTSARSYATRKGYGTVQDLIKDTLREKVFDEPKISKKELVLLQRLLELTEKEDLYGTEQELLQKLGRKDK
jgi:hypothetical protein